MFIEGRDVINDHMPALGLWSQEMMYMAFQRSFGKAGLF